MYNFNRIVWFQKQKLSISRGWFFYDDGLGLGVENRQEFFARPACCLEKDHFSHFRRFSIFRLFFRLSQFYVKSL